MPVFPLDGGQIAREILLWFSPYDGFRQSVVLSIITAGLLAVFAFTQLHSFFAAIFFVAMAMENFVMLRGGGWPR